MKKIFTWLGIISFLIIWGFVFVWIIRNKDEPVYQPADNATVEPPIVGAVGVAAQVASLTPFQPVSITPTSIDTSTPKPEIEVHDTPVSDNRQSVPVIEYETRVQYVTAIVTILHTRIPAATSTPEPTDTATVSALVLQLQHNQYMQHRNDRWQQGLKEWFISPAFLTLIFIVLIILWLYVWTIHHFAPVKLEDTTQTADEINTPVMSDIPGVTQQEYLYICMLHETFPEMSKSEIVRRLTEQLGGTQYSGGAAFYKVKDVIEHISKEGAG